MLPHYADGSKKDPTGKSKGKKQNDFPMSRCLVLFFLACGVAFYVHRKNKADARGLLGLMVLGPHSTTGRLWEEAVNSYFRSIEEKFPVPGWTDDTLKGIGKYTPGEYLDQIKDLEAKYAASKTDEPQAEQPTGALPVGTYQGSCDGCVMTGSPPHLQLTCKCKDTSGQPQLSVFNPDTCKSDEWIGNMNGVLTCEPVPQDADSINALRNSGQVMAAKKAEKVLAEKEAAIAAERKEYAGYEETMQKAMAVKHKTKPGSFFDLFGFFSAKWDM